MGNFARAFSLSGGEVEGDITTVLQASWLPFPRVCYMIMKTKRLKMECGRIATVC
jgi:hypothetical protein